MAGVADVYQQLLRWPDSKTPSALPLFSEGHLTSAASCFAGAVRNVDTATEEVVYRPDGQSSG